MSTVFHFDLSYWNLAVTTLLPVLVALVTKRFAPGQTKTLVLLGLSVVGGLLNQVIAQGGSFQVGQTLWYIVGTFLVAGITHFVGLAPLGLTGAFGAIAKNLPGGVGPAGTELTPQVIPGQATVVTDNAVIPETTNDGLGR